MYISLLCLLVTWDPPPPPSLCRPSRWPKKQIFQTRMKTIAQVFSVRIQVRHGFELEEFFFFSSTGQTWKNETRFTAVCVFWERLLAFFFGDVPRWWGWWCNLQTLDKNTCVWKEHGMEKSSNSLFVLCYFRDWFLIMLVSDWGVELFLFIFCHSGMDLKRV
jgi:hypothetical protein